MLKDVSFEIQKNEVIAVIGPSGSGKSTMLRSLVHLEEINGGSIKLQDQYLVKDGVYASPPGIKAITSRMGMVFQHFNLFPHLTVQENLGLAPKHVKKQSKEEVRLNSAALLNKVGLSDKADVYPGICRADRNSVWPLREH